MNKKPFLGEPKKFPEVFPKIEYLYIKILQGECSFDPYPHKIIITHETFNNGIVNCNNKFCKGVIDLLPIIKEMYKKKETTQKGSEHFIMCGHDFEFSIEIDYKEKNK